MKDNHHLYIGIDRSDASIDICALDPSGEKSAQTKINSAPEAFSSSNSPNLPPTPVNKFNQKHLSVHLSGLFAVCFLFCDCGEEFGITEV